MTLTRTLRGVMCAGVLAAGLVAAAPVSAHSPGASTSPVPANLVPPAGNAPFATFGATGVQVYTCTAGAWTFTEPAAILTGKAKGFPGPQTATHFRGPSWQSTRDGSLVEAKSVASSPVSGAIPQLLLQATRTRGDGVFGAVTYIQRLDTSGGVAPASACVDGQTSGVPYRAVYRFFTAA
ncbi:DUF3455 domain-containing protein [Phytohabitans aurantiacus]|jgi:hypothetical protein|uniref:DUF3455 domain-containing protein n=1 Tax=Phytohabitans aurantiacus TaxID=3016789 RepID=A0ABQ5RB10_9ACTN|nr:DUF3455 domain-containing protein [Phytohabitans aurantiacus]GLI03931.1 hypothetical protein Pa4123_92120 [Phytohabitans aurantiacus]